MNIFIYDYTFEGLLTCIFDAYFRKTFPDLLLKEGEPLPLFYDETFHVSTDERKAMRVWRGLEKKISHHALSALTYCWLSELPEVDKRLFRYIRKGYRLTPFHRNELCRCRRTRIIENLQESGRRTGTSDAVCPLSESCGRNIFCCCRATVQCPPSCGGAFQRPFCRPTVAYLRRETAIRILL